MLAIAVVEPLPNDFEVSMFPCFWELSEANRNTIVDCSFQI